jgi:hypothetical protein
LVGAGPASAVCLVTHFTGSDHRSHVLVHALPVRDLHHSHGAPGPEVAQHLVCASHHSLVLSWGLAGRAYAVWHDTAQLLPLHAVRLGPVQDTVQLRWLECHGELVVPQLRKAMHVVPDVPTSIGHFGQFTLGPCRQTRLHCTCCLPPPQAACLRLPRLHCA